MIFIMTKFWEQYFASFWLGQLFLMNFNIWTESSRNKRGLDFITGCGYKIESGLQKNDIASFFIYSIIIFYDG